MCGECSEDGGATSCSDFHGDGICHITFIYCLQPHESDPIETTFPLDQATFPISNSSSYTFDVEDGFVVQEGSGTNYYSNRNNFWNRSNPFTRELHTWPVRV